MPPQFRRALFIVVLAVISINAKPARAELVAGGNTAFRSALNACLEQFAAAGGETAEIAEILRRPRPRSRRHTIQPPPEGMDGNNTRPTNGLEGFRNRGRPGLGSGTNIFWDPNDRAPFPDGTPRDPCVSLIHEFQHALDMQNGVGDPSPHGMVPGFVPTSVPDGEVRACRAENRFRAARTPPLPQRRSWRGLPLPSDAIF